MHREECCRLSILNNESQAHDRPCRRGFRSFASLKRHVDEHRSPRHSVLVAWPAPARETLIGLLTRPTDNVCVRPYSTKVSISTQRDNIRIAAMLAGILVGIIGAPRIFWDMADVRSTPRLDAFWLYKQGTQALNRGREVPVSIL